MFLTAVQSGKQWKCPVTWWKLLGVLKSQKQKLLFGIILQYYVKDLTRKSEKLLNCLYFILCCAMRIYPVKLDLREFMRFLRSVCATLPVWLTQLLPCLFRSLPFCPTGVFLYCCASIMRSEGKNSQRWQLLMWFWSSFSLLSKDCVHWSLWYFTISLFTWFIEGHHTGDEREVLGNSFRNTQKSCCFFLQYCLQKNNKMETVWPEQFTQ